jgi:hypothetical protein
MAKANGLVVLVNYIAYQWPRFIFDPFICLTTLEEAGIIPSKHSDTRI